MIKEKEKQIKTLSGRVISDKMDKTIVVEIVRRVRHRLYKKIVTKTSKIHAHDENNECAIGDLVKIVETRPYSKTKAWKLVEIMERSGNQRSGKS